MKALLIISLLAITKAQTIQNGQVTTPQPQPVLANGIQELAFDISVAKSESGHHGNLMFSPLSIGSLLSLLMLGTGGQTQRELQLALSIPNSLNTGIIHSTFKELLDKYKKGNSLVEVLINNRLFVQEGVNVFSTFTSACKTFYDTSVQSQNFKDDPTGSMSNINNWVNRSTKGKIPQLLTQPMSTDTIFSAVNTLYLNAPWDSSFIKLATKPRPFYSNDQIQNVSMMHNVIAVPYVSDNSLNVEMIAIPYRGRKMAMFIIKPRHSAKEEALNQLEFSLDAGWINNLVSRMVEETVSIGLPRMRLGSKFNLKDTLNKLEVSSIFNPQAADFERITSDVPLWVGDIIHEAVLEITETGTVGAAATAVNLDRIGASRMFIVDRPSILFIKDLENGLTLFWGRVVNPEPI